jgi:hypothetical protein
MKRSPDEMKTSPVQVKMLRNNGEPPSGRLRLSIAQHPGVSPYLFHTEAGVY